MQIFKKSPPPPETKSPKRWTDWATAIVGLFGAVVTLMSATLYLDGRILRVELQNQAIGDDLKDIKRSIEENVYPRREAELRNAAIEERVKSVSDRVDRLEEKR